MWPTPVTSGLSKRATPSWVVRRSPRSTLSAIGNSDGSMISERSSWTGTGTMSLLELSNGQRHVVTAEAEAVAQHRSHRATHRGVRRVVEIEPRLGSLVVDRR